MRVKLARVTTAVSLLALVWLVACRQPTAVPPPIIPLATQPPTSTATLEAASPPPIIPLATQPPSHTLTPAITAITAIAPTATATAVATAIFSGPASPTCGQLLPLFSAQTAVATTTSLDPDPAALAQLEQIIPDAALPALRHLLDNPQNVGLALYRVGQEANGAYLNADVPMPLASVVKLIHLVAYAEAVAEGRLNPLSTLSLAEIESYYLPRSDLGAHLQAVAELTANGRTFGDPPQMILDEVPWLMIRHSSNAATDYLHMLLGQETIEATAVSLGLTSQTAPCPFLAQFLAMSNHIRTSNDLATLQNYLANPTTYGQESMLLMDGFMQNQAFRDREIAWRLESRQPTLSTQEFFVANLNAQASPNDYAQLMARIAQNGLSNGESSYTVRRFLEWPMRFPDNQAIFDNLGYKNGRFPGLLTTVYYAYPDGQTTPIVIALFYRNLPNNIYQQWRNSLPHDELARWLLADPAALPALRDVITR